MIRGAGRTRGPSRRAGLGSADHRGAAAAGRSRRSRRGCVHRPLEGTRHVLAKPPAQRLIECDEADDGGADSNTLPRHVPLRRRRLIAPTAPRAAPGAGRSDGAAPAPRIGRTRWRSHQRQDLRPTRSTSHRSAIPRRCASRAVARPQRPSRLASARRGGPCGSTAPLPPRCRSAP
jgi:hypothetical protein